MVPVRLDVVVKVKQREEERRLEALAGTLRAAQAARHALALAEAEARHERRRQGSAAEYSDEELARQRLLERVAAARAKLEQATAAVEQSRAEWTAAHRGAEAVRRVADARRSEVVEERERAERKTLDELALLQFARAG